MRSSQNANELESFIKDVHGLEPTGDGTIDVATLIRKRLAAGYTLTDPFGRVYTSENVEENLHAPPRFPAHRQTKRARAEVIGDLHSEHSSIRAGAALQLAAWDPDAQLIELLRDRLSTDPDTLVRGHAGHSLLAHDDTESFAAVVELLSRLAGEGTRASLMAAVASAAALVDYASSHGGTGVDVVRDVLRELQMAAVSSRSKYRHEFERLLESMARTSGDAIGR